MAKLPVRIVADGTNVSGGLGHRSLGPGTALILESDYGVANISGGVIPMTQAEYAIAAGSAVVEALSPAAWFKFNQGITVTGAGVSQWDDQSGNARHLKQGSDTNRPAKQSDGSILFDGVDNYLKCDAFALNQPETVYLLFKQVTWTGTDGVFDGNTLNVMRLYQTNATPQLDMFAGVSGPSTTGLAVNAYGAVACVFNGVNSVLQVNNNTPATSANNLAGNGGGFTLGANGDNLQFGNIQVKEAIIFAAAHTAAERARVIAYLMQLAGI
jgi:hypothetical protein